MVRKRLILQSLLGICVVAMIIPSAAEGQDLLVSSWTTHSVRRYDVTTGEYLGDFIPPGGGGLSLPDGFTFGPDGNFYVSSANTDQVLRYDGQTGHFIDVFAFDGLDRPSFHQFGPDGHLYVCDANHEVVSRFDGETGEAMGVFASGNGLDFPAGLLWRDDLLYVSSFTGGEVLRYDATTGDFFDVFTSEPVRPLYLRVTEDGNLSVSDYNQNSLRIYDGETGTLVDTWSHFTLSGPVGQIIAPDGSLIVASWNNHRLIRLNGTTGEFIEVLAQGDGLQRPNDLIFMLPVPCPADLDGDGAVGASDLAQLLGAWGPNPGHPADFDDDGVVSAADLALLLGSWGGCP